ncbi:glycoside hydrolase family 31 protein [Vallitalea okinawensis]|uniref:glycoside hydrolase family 31 protein n=1 Tax=Vallitalea okinawensis TaxID=2078660 RepID=UPI000CFDE90A|nr:TIM-barrel domain-containing protein [Vallitalea okinawensis]
MAVIDVLEGVGISTPFKRERFSIKEIGSIVDSQVTKTGLSFTCSSGAIGRMDFLVNDSVHLYLSTTGQESQPYPLGENQPYMIENTCLKECEFEIIKDNNEEIQVKIEKYLVCISKDNFDLKVVMQEDEDKFDWNTYCILDGSTICWNERELFWDMSKKSEEHFYGTGLRRCYPLNENTILHKIEKNTWDGKSVPFYMSSQGYGVFVNTSQWDTSFNFNGDEVEIIVPKSDVLDAYLFFGDYKEVLYSYHQLTGMPFMPPKWSLGYWNGRYSYRTQEEVLDNAKKFREKNIPCDVLFLDLMWRGVYRPNEVTDLTWDYECFPDPIAMIEELDQMNIKLITHVNTTCNIEAKDFSNPAHIEHWKNQIRPLIDEGTKGFMVDGGEGKGMNENFMNWNVYGGKFYNGMYPEEMANIWGLLYNKTVVEAMREAKPNERMFGLTRAATSGSQRYGLVWFGDHESTWEDLRSEIMAGMEMSMSGLPFWTMDIGGIQGEPKKDLFIRWLQFGCFIAVARTHGRFPKEPWLYGTSTESIARDILQLRMRLMPYIYSLIWKMHTKAVPPVQPMAMAYSENKELATIWDQWMFGDALLVAPVYEKDTYKRRVVLPKGKWLELGNGVIHDSEKQQTVDVNAPLETIPLFMKEGSILTMKDDSQNHVSDGNCDQLDIYLFPSQQGCRFSQYEDDGMSIDYLEKHELIEVKQCYVNNVLTVDVEVSNCNFTSDYKYIEIKIINHLDKQLRINNEIFELQSSYCEMINQDIHYVKVKLSEIIRYN